MNVILLWNMAPLIPYKESFLCTFLSQKHLWNSKGLPALPSVREGPRSCFPGWAVVLSHCQLLLLMPVSLRPLLDQARRGCLHPRAPCTPGCRSRVSCSSPLTCALFVWWEWENLFIVCVQRFLFSFSACASDSLPCYLLLSSFLLVWGKGNVLSL